MAQQDPNLPDTLILEAFAGLKNTISKHRLGPADLEKGVNIDLDDVGQPRRRRGYTLKLAGDFHSVQNVGGLILGVKDDLLGIINPDYTFDSLGEDVGSGKVATVDIDDTIYWSNDRASGKVSISGRTSSPWGYQVSESEWLSPVITPTDYLQPVAGKLIGPPPLAEYMTYLNGRIYLANDKVIWATELYLYDYVDKTRNFIQFEKPITGIMATPRGMYVGTTDSIWFMSGPLGEMSRRRVVTSGMIPGSMLRVNGSYVKPALEQRNTEEDAVLFMTDDGLVAGFDQGVCYNMTQDRYEFPDAQTVAPLLREQDGMVQYLMVNDSGGDPANNARIGDYVDAEIVRAGG